MRPISTYLLLLVMFDASQNQKEPAFKCVDLTRVLLFEKCKQVVEMSSTNSERLIIFVHVKKRFVLFSESNGNTILLMQFIYTTQQLHSEI